MTLAVFRRDKFMTIHMSRPISLGSWIIRGGVFAVFAMTLLSLSLCGCGRKGVNVTVSNGSGAELKDIQIRFTGGTNSVQNLAPSQSRSCWVNPRAASSLEVDFVDAAGGRHSKKVDVYIERNFRGEIVITIGPSNTVQWKNNVKI